METRMKIFCDLDGTLIDVSARHYKVYMDTIIECGGVPIAKDVYWDLKRKKTKWPVLLEMSGVSPDGERDFLDRFIVKIEDPEYLRTDTILPGVIKALDGLRMLGDCYLVTLRRNRQNVLWELEYLGLTPHFTDVLTGHSETDGYDVKIQLIGEKLGSDRGVMIGDTEADVIAGKQLGLQTFAVTSGIRDQAFLVDLKPDYIVDGMTEVVAQLRGS